jgi:hypothetical protein
VTPAQTIYAWGGQVETNFMSSYIPTLSAAVTRAGDVLSYPIASVTGFDATKGTLVHEYILEGTPVGFSAPAALVGANVNADLIIPDGYANGTVTAPVLNRAVSSRLPPVIPLSTTRLLPFRLVPSIRARFRGRPVLSCRARMMALRPRRTTALFPCCRSSPIC